MTGDMTAGCYLGRVKNVTWGTRINGDGWKASAFLPTARPPVRVNVT